MLGACKLLVTAACLLPTLAYSETFNVTNTSELRGALEEAATNGEDDIIILSEGTYKTTDDGLGEFSYLSDENFNIELKGNNAETTILSGDSTDSILSATFLHNNQLLSLRSLTFINSTDYAVTSSQRIEATDCVFENNQNGFKSWKYAVIRKCKFINNSTYGFEVNGTSSTVTTKVYDSIFDGNSKGIKSYYYSDAQIENSIFTNNTTGAHITGFTISNSIFKDNIQGLYINDQGSRIDSENTVINSIFTSNTTNITGTNQSVITLRNNYIDDSTVSPASFNYDNIFQESSLGFIDESNEDFRLSEHSTLIDKGIILNDHTTPNFDISGNPRIIGNSIDIGPYEFIGDASIIDTWNPVTNEIIPHTDTNIPEGWLTDLPIAPSSNLLPLTITVSEIDGTPYSSSNEQTYYPDGTLYIAHTDSSTDTIGAWEAEDNRLKITSPDVAVPYYIYFTNQTESQSEVVIVVPYNSSFSKQVITHIDRPQYVLDTDNDTIADVIDSFPYNSSYSQDSDSDGIPDEWEARFSINADQISDTDEDGVTDINEYLAGTDPLTVTHYMFTQSDLDTAEQDAIAACANNPESCGITAQTSSDSSDTQPYTYSLTEGWNLIGGKDATDTSSIQSFLIEHNADSIWHWDNRWISYIDGTPEYLNNLTNMNASKGYFVHIPNQQ